MQPCTSNENCSDDVLYNANALIARDRELFKLPKIDLISENTGVVVEPIFEGDRGRRQHPTSTTMVVAPEAERSEAPRSITPALPTLPPAKQLLQPADAPITDENHDGGALRSTQVDPSPKLLAQNIGNVPTMSSRGHEHVVPVSAPINGHPHMSGAPYPDFLQVKMEAMDRLYERVASSQRALDERIRDFSRLEGAIHHLDNNMRIVFEEFAVIRRELAARPPGPPPPAPGTNDDRTLEVFTQNLTQVATKANEVDGVKMALELIKRRLARLEDTNPAPSPATVNGQFPRDIPPHPGPPVPQPPPGQPILHVRAQPLPSPRQIVEPRFVNGPPAHMVAQVPPMPHPSDPSSRTLEADSQPSAGGWTTVNSNAKRGHPNGVDGRVDISGTPHGSPKRPKLAPLEPRHNYPDAGHSNSFENDREPPHLRPHSTESYPGSAVSQTQLYGSYQSTNQANPDDSWRPESQPPTHVHAHSNSTSPKRGGRGAGRGRSRKSGEPDLMETPEWERNEWTGSQVGPDGFYQPIAAAATRGGRGGSTVIRRGSGGAQSPPIIRPGATVMIQQSPGDPYAHTKKSRTKPIRNSDGVLIRKDGRPDMRSQSSAANLRKVHARKEEERMREISAGGEPGMLGSSGLAHSISAEEDRDRDSMSQSPETPDQAEAQIQGDTSEEQSRHEMVMKEMFPRGVDTHRKQVYGFPSSDDDRDSERGTIDVRPVASRQESDVTDSEMRIEETQPTVNPTEDISPVKPAAPAPLPIEMEEKSGDAEMKDAEPVAAAGTPAASA